MARSRQRQRTEKQAVDLLNEACLSPAQRLSAVERIRSARQPCAEARRIVEHAQRDAGRGVVERDDCDLSDVQELRARLIRRDGGIWPPHTDMLTRMERMVALGEMDRPIFDGMGGELLAMDQEIPRAQRVGIRGFSPG